MTVPRVVLGNDYVDKAIANTTNFTRPLQNMIAENCWGEVWVRDGLSKKTRSMITIAMLVALRMSAELKAHILGVLRNGCTVEEIQEVLLQATVYCGVPAGVETFRAAKEVIESWQKDKNEHDTQANS